MDLRPYQQKAIEAAIEAKKRGVTRQLLVLATGLGKTVIVGGLIKELGLPRTLGFMHRDELLTQARDKIRMVNGDITIGIEKASERVNLESDKIALASVQTIGRKDKKRLSRFAPEWPELTWIDEAHHAPANSYQSVLEHFRFYGKEPDRSRLLIGTTATPDRLDGKLYDNIFDDVVFRYGLREGIQDGWLADIKAYYVDVELNLAGVHVRGGDFVMPELALAVKRSNMDAVAFDTWVKYCIGKKSLFFCVDKAHAYRTQGSLEKAGAKVSVVVDDTKREERQRILLDFEESRLDVVVNVGVLTEGFDCPSIQCIHILKPTKSKTVYAQMVGRGTRKTPTKDSVEVFDYTEEGHDVCSIGRIFGLPPRWKLNGQSVLGDLQRAEVLRTQLGLASDDVSNLDELLYKLRRRKFSMLMNEIVDNGLPSGLAWLRPSKDEERWVISWKNEGLDYRHMEANERTRRMLHKYQLSGAAERVEVFKNEIGNYEAKWVGVYPREERTRKMASNPSLTRLVNEVEAMIFKGRSHQVGHLQKGSPWRRSAASEHEKHKLEAAGVPTWVLPCLTKGDALALSHCSPELITKMFKDIQEPKGLPS